LWLGARIIKGRGRRSNHALSFPLHTFFEALARSNDEQQQKRRGKKKKKRAGVMSSGSGSGSGRGEG